ncbi:hypothetical protein MMC13_006638 [Lambiella insularis]|nr:hypothetical protein [Lambiella insularis]
MDYPALWNSQAGIAVIVITTVFESLAILAVILRLWSRRIQRTKLVLNDYAVLAALLFTTGLSASIVLAVTWAGEGQPYANIPPQLKGRIYITYEIETPIWGAAISLVKISILHLYLTIFPSRVFKRICYGMMGVSAAWFVGVLLQTFLLCRPFALNWDHTITGTCGDTTMAQLSIGSANLIIDAIIVTLPLPLLWRLKLPVWKRIGILAMFSLGAFTCVVTLMRVIRIHDLLNVTGTDFADEDPTLTGATIAEWSILEPTIGIINSCFPVMRPVLRKLFPFSTWAEKITSKYGSGRRSRASVSGKHSPFLSNNSSAGKKHFQRLENDMYPLPDKHVGNNRALASTYHITEVDVGRNLC